MMRPRLVHVVILAAVAVGAWFLLGPRFVERVGSSWVIRHELAHVFGGLGI